MSEPRGFGVALLCVPPVRYCGFAMNTVHGSDYIINKIIIVAIVARTRDHVPIETEGEHHARS
jgi:hypothetical protein